MFLRTPHASRAPAVLQRTCRRPARRPARRIGPVALGAALLIALCCGASAELQEQVMQMRVHADWLRPPAPVLSMLVTLVYETSAPRRPFVVLLHGRPTAPQDFARMGIQQYPANARWLAEQGYAVLIPTRIGYGRSGGPDMEFAGPCSAKDYRLPLLAMRSEVHQLLTAARQWPGVDVRRGLVLGESFGALGALALADGSQPGVLGVVNVAGGDGGDFAQPDHPCAPGAVARAFGALGSASHLRSLWLYSRNDHLWGDTLPSQWFARYQQAGGRGRFVELEAVPGNGHFVFNRRPLAWQAPLLEFARSVGVPPLAAAPAPGAR